jgi:predicted metal-dependent phosphoesterase TrpH
MKINIDLHVHTKYSKCALLNPDEIEPLALKRGLDAVAITDHNTIAGALEVKNHAKKIKVIIGEEIKTTKGEIIGYFLNEQISPFLSPEETIKEIKHQGGLASVPHPFDRLRSSRLEAETLEKILPNLDMIEIFNSRDILTGQDFGLIEKACQMGSVPVAGSDAHLRIEVGRSYLTMEDFEGPEDFLEKIKKSHYVKRKSPFWVHLATKVIRFYRNASKKS